MSYLNDGTDGMLLYQTEQIRQLEQWGVQHGQLTESEMMRRAGQGALRILLSHYPQTKTLAICCGKGNNAGDGVVMAAAAQQAGLNVRCYLISDISDIKLGPASEAANLCTSQSIPMLPLTIHTDFESSDLIVDAILGIGLQGEVNEGLAAIIEHINHTNIPVMSLDCPSGLEVDTGKQLGCSVKADTTITFIAPKLGLYTYQGVASSGDVIVDDLQFPANSFEQVSPVAKIVSNQEINPLLPKRCRSSHKGNYGHVLVIGGDYGMGGAVRMAAEAALRTGAGLVSVATRPEHVTVVNATRPEIMCHEVVNSEDIDLLLERANVIVCGPGLGQAEWSMGLFERVMQTDKPKVMDADCLNILSTKPCHHDHWILTPHPGEASRLLGIECSQVQSDRLGSVHELQRRYGGVALLKGAGTLVQSQNTLTALCSAGNPGMATAGMGDILSGILGGLLAQGLSLTDAAMAGVWVHANAADCAAIAGGERGMLATDVLKYLREMVNPL